MRDGEFNLFEVQATHGCLHLYYPANAIKLTMLHMSNQVNHVHNTAKGH